MRGVYEGRGVGKLAVPMNGNQALNQSLNQSLTRPKRETGLSRSPAWASTVRCRMNDL